MWDKKKKKSLPPIAGTAENIILTIKKKKINQMFPEANVMMCVAEGGGAGAYEAASRLANPGFHNSVTIAFILRGRSWQQIDVLAAEQLI